MTSWMVPIARPPPSWIECGLDGAGGEALAVGGEGFEQAVLDDDGKAEGDEQRRQDIAAERAVEERVLQRIAEREQHRRRHQRAEERPDAQRLRQRQHDEGRQHDEIAVRQVDEPHDAEDQRQAGGEQRVEPAQHDALQQAC